MITCLNICQGVNWFGTRGFRGGGIGFTPLYELRRQKFQNEKKTFREDEKMEKKLISPGRKFFPVGPDNHTTQRKSKVGEKLPWKIWVSGSQEEGKRSFISTNITSS